jgi:RNA polymerase sigma-70 factor (ECF subfamily)
LQPAAGEVEASLPPAAREFPALYTQYHDFIWRLLLHLGVRERDVADVTHGVFLIAYRKWGEFEHRSSPRTWLYGIALRAARNHARKGAVRREIPEAEPDARATTGAEASTEALHARRQLALAEQVLDSLAAEQREVFILHELEQMTGSEIAALLGVPEGTVRSRLRLGRAAFQKQVAELRRRGLLDD